MYVVSTHPFKSASHPYWKCPNSRRTGFLGIDAGDQWIQMICKLHHRSVYRAESPPPSAGSCLIPGSCCFLESWLTTIAWVTVLATGSIFVGTIIRGLMVLNHPTYVPEVWHGTLLCWSVIAVAVFINTAVSGLLPIIEGLILVFHILGFVAVLISLVQLSPHGSGYSVFQTWVNEGKWPTQRLSFCVGFIGNVATFVDMCSIPRDATVS